MRWHYGVAHPILAGIEDSFVAEYGRDWLRDAEKARTKLVKGPEKLSGLRWFDFREIWQIMSAMTVVVGCVAGAFILSYSTPTVGLGCRSGGYLVFTVIALGTFVLEMLVWWLVPEGSTSDDDTLIRIATNVERRLSRTPSNTWTLLGRSRVKKMLSWWQKKTVRDRIEVLLLRPLEVCNSIWLTYIVFAQTFGSYRNCDCMASIWGSIGGYMDFQDIEFYRDAGVGYYWGFGTGLSGCIMVISFAFIVTEWCTQSHLSTEDFESAGRGLMRTRRFKKYTCYFREIPDWVIEVVKITWLRVMGKKTSGDRARRSLVWMSETKAHKRRLSSIPTIIEGKAPTRSDSWAHGGEETELLGKSKDGNEWAFDLQRLMSPTETHPRSPGSPRSPRSSFGELGQRAPSLRGPLGTNSTP